MKFTELKTFLLIMLLIACSPVDEDFQCGRNYNSIRKEYGAPIIKDNMFPENCCGEWTVYRVDESKIKQKSYHRSKTIRLVIDDEVANEEDIYINKVNDSITLQLNFLSIYNRKNKSLDYHGNYGPIQDLHNGWVSLEANQIDSVLNSWGLSRFDK